jgi:glutathione peroxidase
MINFFKKIFRFFDRKLVLAAPQTFFMNHNFHQFKLKSLDGSQLVDFQSFSGKKIVILNVASECGYTPQYADWQLFYEENKENCVVLGFPCNQFGNQEPGTVEQIASFCEKNYGVTFPMFEKIDVSGSKKSPVYDWLTDPEKNGWNNQAPNWNFCKYVVNENGELTHFFASGVVPSSPEFLKAVE